MPIPVGVKRERGKNPGIKCRPKNPDANFFFQNKKSFFSLTTNFSLFPFSDLSHVKRDQKAMKVEERCLSKIWLVFGLILILDHQNLFAAKRNSKKGKLFFSSPCCPFCSVNKCTMYLHQMASSLCLFQPRKKGS